jgi:acetyl-CoA carboxylase biotin carboxylase subunit
VEYLRIPSGPGIRWDGGIETGSEVGLHYDPLLAKLIVWGDTRALAIRRMGRALEELVLVGVTTSQPFHRRVMAEPAFQAGEYDIGYVERVGAGLLEAAPSRGDLELAAIAAALAEHEARRLPRPVPASRDDGASAWMRSARLGALRWSR